MGKIKLVPIEESALHMHISDQSINVGDLVTYQAFDGYIKPFTVDRIGNKQSSENIGVFTKESENVFKWMWDLDSCFKVTMVEGNSALFIEHWALITDEDSGMEEPWTVLIKDDVEEPITLVEKISCKQCTLAMTGNSVSAEYHGVTGRTVICEVALHKNRLIWQVLDELTPATDDLSSYYKM